MKKRYFGISNKACMPAHAGLQEGSHLDPTNPYSAAKAGAEMLCKVQC